MPGVSLPHNTTAILKNNACVGSKSIIVNSPKKKPNECQGYKFVVHDKKAHVPYQRQVGQAMNQYKNTHLLSAIKTDENQGDNGRGKHKKDHVVDICRADKIKS